MRKGAAIALTLGIAFCLPAVARAQTATSQPLSFVDAVAIALQKNPAYLVSAADIDAAQSRLRAARGPLAPSVSISDAYAVVDPIAQLQTPIGSLPFSQTNATNVPLASVGYTLFDGGATAARIARADADLAAAQAARREAHNATVGRVGAAYYDLAAAIGEGDVAEHAVSVASQHVELAQQRFSFGIAAHADVLQAQTQLADARVRAIDARNAVDRASNVLDAALGVPLATKYRPSDPLDAAAADVSLDAMLASARTSRGELQAARDAVVAARHAVDEAKAARAPRVGITVSEGNVQPPVQAGFRAQFAVALNAIWTVFDNGLTAANVATAEAGVHRANLEVDQLQTSIELDVHQAYADQTAARERLGAARALVELASENLRLVEVRYHGGVGTIYELRDAELQDTNARQTLITAQASLRRSVIALRVAAGLQ